MLTGEDAWSFDVEYDSEDSLMSRIGYSDELPSIPSSLSTEARDFVNRCLVKNTAHRWSVDELLSHPFLAVDNKKDGAEEKSRGKAEHRVILSPRTPLQPKWWISISSTDATYRVAASTEDLKLKDEKKRKITDEIKEDNKEKEVVEEVTKGEAALGEVLRPRTPLVPNDWWLSFGSLHTIYRPKAASKAAQFEVGKRRRVANEVKEEDLKVELEVIQMKVRNFEFAGLSLNVLSHELVLTKELGVEYLNSLIKLYAEQLFLMNCHSDRHTVMVTVGDVVLNLVASDIDACLEELLSDCIPCEFQEQTSNEANVILTAVPRGCEISHLRTWISPSSNVYPWRVADTPDRTQVTGAQTAVEATTQTTTQVVLVNGDTTNAWGDTTTTDTTNAWWRQKNKQAEGTNAERAGVLVEQNRASEAVVERVEATIDIAVKELFQELKQQPKLWRSQNQNMIDSDNDVGTADNEVFYDVNKSVDGDVDNGEDPGVDNTLRRKGERL
ncbi:hypothetical protein IFM89_021900 [Coptis chinensis]|uniref:Protein kinase domain-containing protein n=1 Tax=Coptis chinensis TaxID=261450 RepID=A0A835HCC6_9MAGN|nr:hypothetical protein IFM89_021900 [Coptis chinensis]